jgi:multicomponent Na+:H+ antiporter subunit A
VIWGIVILLFAFFLGPLAEKTLPRLGLAALYIISCFCFLNALLEMEAPLYYHFVPQTFALFDLSFVADVLSLTFCLITTLIGAIVMAYSAYYIDEEDGPRFSTLINFFTLSMLGLVLSHNLLGLFIFWEFTSICSYFLISFDGSNEEARRAGRQSLFILALGGVALLCGILILGGIGGSYDLLQIRIPQNHPWMTTSIILIFIGILTKSAQFPFHFWLPNAMTAPAPASAYLHSATLVNAGIFLLFRLSPFLSIHEYWGRFLIPAGILTAVVASVRLLFERDLKKILAYTTLASLGLITYMIGRNDAQGYYLAMTWLIAHALYKAPLFLLAGSIERYSGSRDVTVLSQLYPRMKGSLLVALLGAISLLGIPPVFSYHAKEEFFTLLGESPLLYWAIVFLFAVSGSVAFTILSLFIKGDRNEAKNEGKFFDDLDDPALMWLPAAAALVVSLMLGARYSPLTQFIRDNLGQTLSVDFDLVNFDAGNKKLALFASAAVVFFSIFFAAIATRLRKMSFKKLSRYSLDGIWEASFEFLLKGGQFLFNRIQNNRIELYSLTYFVFLIYLISQISGMELALPILSMKFTLVTPFEVSLCIVMMGAAFAAVRAETNLAALAVLGIVGFGTGYLYLVNSAPDLALTQFLIESLTLLLLVLTFRYLPKKPYNFNLSFPLYFFRWTFWVKSSVIKTLFIIVSGTIGIIAGALSFLASSSLRPQTLTRFFGEKAFNIAHGRNVVNVAIIDFRGLDTLGEITVLAIAAVGVASLIKRKDEGSALQK